MALSISKIWQAFWDWSWDELVSFDLPAIFDFVFGQTGQKIDYVGHSLVRIILYRAPFKAGI
jgi:lysosomal acid lipase/cholesteryl ester hydrolase